MRIQGRARLHLDVSLDHALLVGELQLPLVLPDEAEHFVPVAQHRIEAHAAHHKILVAASPVPVVVRVGGRADVEVLEILAQRLAVTVFAVVGHHLAIHGQQRRKMPLK